MHLEESLQQRALDGVLPREQAVGLAALIASRPDLARQAATLQTLDADLRRMAGIDRASHLAGTTQLTGGSPADAEHVRLRQAIMARIAARVPASQVRVRPLDIIYAAAAAVLVFAAYGLTRATVRTLFEQAVVMTWAIGLSLALGLLLLILPSFLRRAEAGLLRSVMRRPIAIGPADILIYRAVGVALVVGGIWLTY